MKRFRKTKTVFVLLSVLILASTASVRSSKAEEAPAISAGEEPQAVYILKLTCAQDPEREDCSAALAAERIRFDAGLISLLSTDGKRTRNQRLTAAFAAARRVMEQSLALDWTGWNATLVGFQSDVYDCYAQNQPAFSALADFMNGALQSACATCGKVLSRDLRAANIPLNTTGQCKTRLSWRECAALYYAFGNDMARILFEATAIQQEGSVFLGVTMRWPTPTFAEIAAHGEKEQLVEAKLALYYLNTVYEDDGSVAPVEPYNFSKEYLATIQHPVPGGTIKDGWYDPRSHRTRLHVGTDIRVAAKTPILSVTDGVVLHIGFLPIPGYYVIVRDPFGFEYHYYHMFERTIFVQEGDAVKQGQQLGRVGSTGNSVANHLHLGLVSPTGVYLNPFDLFVQAGIGPILSE